MRIGLKPTQAAAAQFPVARSTIHASPSTASASSAWKNSRPHNGDEPHAPMPAAEIVVKTGPYTEPVTRERVVEVVSRS